MNLDSIFSDTKNKEAINKFFIFMISDMGTVSHHKGKSFFYSSGFDQQYDGIYAFSDNKVYTTVNGQLSVMKFKIPKNYKTLIKHNFEEMESIE
jgi:hypothetical protein